MTRRTLLLLVLASVVVGGALRGWGLFYGLDERVAGIAVGPMDLRPDEHFYREAARAFDAGNFRPPHDAYPSLAWYSAYGVLKTGWWIERFTGGTRPFTAWLDDLRASHGTLRVWSWLCGTVTIALVAWFARRLRGDVAGVIAGGFFAVAFLPVRDAHAGTLDVPAALVTLIAIIAVDAAARDGTRRSMLRAAVAVGVATAWRWLPAGLGVALAYAILGGPRETAGTLGRKIVRCLVAACVAVITAAICMPHVWTDVAAFRASLATQAAFSGRIDVDLLTRVLWIWGTGLDAALGAALALAGVVGLVLYARRVPVRGGALALATAALLLPLAGIPLNFFRYLEPVLPPIVIGAAILVADLMDATPRRARLVGVFAFGWLAVDPAWRSVEAAALYATPTTSGQLAAWWRREGGGSKISSPADRGLEGIPASALLGFDPVAWEAEKMPWFLVLTRGGTGVTDWIGPVSPVLARDPACRRVATFTGFEPGGHRVAAFEALDRTDYPWRRFDRVVRPGPDIEVWRVDPSVRGLVPPAPSLRFDPDVGRGRIVVEGAAPLWPLAYVLTVDREPPIPGVAPIDGIVVSPAAPWMDVPASFPAGRYSASVRARLPASIGPSSPAVGIQLR